MTDAKRKGDKAQILMNDPTLTEAFELVKANIYRQIEESSFAQKNEREDAYRMLRALTSVRGELKKMIRHAKGEIAKDQARVVLNLAEHKE